MRARIFERYESALMVGLMVMALITLTATPCWAPGGASRYSSNYETYDGALHPEYDSDSWDITGVGLSSSTPGLQFWFGGVGGFNPNVLNSTGSSYTILANTYFGLEATMTWSDPIHGQSIFVLKPEWEYASYLELEASGYNQGALLIKALSDITISNGSSYTIFDHTTGYLQPPNNGTPYASESLGTSDLSSLPNYGIKIGMGQLGPHEEDFDTPEPAAVVGIVLVVIAAGLRRMRKQVRVPISE